jgi:DNA-binding response OmpR family regulator
MNEDVLLSGDAPERLATLADYLDHCDGISARAVATAHDVIAAARASYFHAFVIDGAPPGIAVPELCRVLRRIGVRSPIFVATPPGVDAEVILALEAGASAVLFSPARPGELLARLRYSSKPAEIGDRLPISLGKVDIDPRRRLLLTGDGHIALSDTEMRILICLARAPGHAAARDVIARVVWRVASRQTLARVKCHVYRLRRKAGGVLSIATTPQGYFLDI